MAKFKFPSIKPPSQPTNPDLARQYQTGNLQNQVIGGWFFGTKSIQKDNIRIDSVEPSISFLDSNGVARVKLSNQALTIYDSDGTEVGNFTGETAGGVGFTSFQVLVGNTNVISLTDQGIGGDPAAISDTIDGILMSSSGDIYLTTRKTGGTGGQIYLLPPSGGRVNVYERLRIVPRSSAPSSPAEGDLYVNSTDHKLYIYNGTSWVVVGTQT